jgi:hypothetical protein
MGMREEWKFVTGGNEGRMERQAVTVGVKEEYIKTDGDEGMKAKEIAI